MSVEYSAKSTEDMTGNLAPEMKRVLQLPAPNVMTDLIKTDSLQRLSHLPA